MTTHEISRPMPVRLTGITALVVVGVFAFSALCAPALAQGLAGTYLAAKNAEVRGDVAAAADFYGQALARDGDNPELLERAMMHKIAAGELAEGIALARQHEEIAPGHYLGVLALAASHMRTGAANEVSVLLNDGGPFVGRLMEAWSYFADGDAAGARERFTQMSESDEDGRPGQIFSIFHLGMLEAAIGNDEAAVKALARAIEMSNGGTIRMVTQHAGALARLDRVDEARDVIRKRLSGTYGNITLEKLDAALAAGNVPAPSVRTAEQGAAEGLFSIGRQLRDTLISLGYARLATYLDPDFDRAHLLIAQLLDESEQYELAIEAYGAVPRDSELALGALTGRAGAIRDAGDPDAGIEAMREVVAAYSASIEAHTSLGDMLRRESRFEEASDAYDRAIKLLPLIESHHWAIFYQRGITYERSKQWDQAEADFRKALELMPDQPDVLNYPGSSLVELGRTLEEAESMIEKAVEQRPEDGYIVDSLGWVLYRFSEFERAVEHLGRAVELRPVDPVINDHYGDALWMVGRRTEARFQWKRALSFEPEEKDVKRIRRKLDVGLDKVLLDEREEGLPGIIGRSSPSTEDDAKSNDGG